MYGLECFFLCLKESETVCTSVQLLLLCNKNGMLTLLLEPQTEARGEHQEFVGLGRLERCWGPPGCEQGLNLDPKCKPD